MTNPSGLRFFLLPLSLPAVVGLSALLVGCDRSEEKSAGASRPVTVYPIQISRPAAGQTVTGSVASWKTEQIGFEVAGRVDWVLEPGREVSASMRDSDGKLLNEGVALAKIEDERYRLAVEAAEAKVSVANYEVESAKINAESKVPSQIKAAEAELSLAKSELDRYTKLSNQNATSQSQLEKASAGLQTAEAQLLGLKADQQRATAGVQSAIAQLKQATQALRDAERDLEDTTLYSSFRGQVADVHVVPGSFVAQGSPVLTVQMMDPIKVEFELSAADSRKVKTHTHLPVTFSLADGRTKTASGYVYMIDPVADPATRTFTMTLLVFNQKSEQALPEGRQAETTATVDDIWRLDLPVMDDKAGMLFTSVDAIGHDASGPYLWRCTNAAMDKNFPNVLQVEKVPIELGPIKLPFLGNWTFQSVVPLPDHPIDASKEVFAGKVMMNGSPAPNWSGSELVLLDNAGDWELRPGDLVKVALDQTQIPEGIYVPMDSIYTETDDLFVFVVRGEGSSAAVSKVAVTSDVNQPLLEGALRLIRPVDINELQPGDMIAREGVHYLRDGEAVSVQFDANARSTNKLASDAPTENGTPQQARGTSSAPAPTVSAEVVE